jgi:hypothetical protein
MQQFVLILKHDKIVSYKRSILAIIGLNLLYFIAQAIITNDSKAINRCLFLVFISLTLFIAEYLLSKRNRKIFSAAIVVCALIMYIYLKIHFWWAAAAMALILLLYLFAIQVPVVFVSANGIKVSIFGKRFLNWEQLNNLVMKDGLVTIDLKNNKLIQQYLDEKSPTVDEKEFNDFCKKQLNK